MKGELRWSMVHNVGYILRITVHTHIQTKSLVRHWSLSLSFFLSLSLSQHLGFVPTPPQNPFTPLSKTHHFSSHKSPIIPSQVPLTLLFSFPTLCLWKLCFLFLFLELILCESYNPIHGQDQAWQKGLGFLHHQGHQQGC